MVVEHAVCNGVPANDGGGPELLHEEHLTSEVVGGGILGGAVTLEPLS